MARDIEKPVIVQSDRSILLDTDSPAFEDARDCLAGFAELVKSPEHIHTYRLSALSLWNAAAAGMGSAEILDGLRRYSKYDVPQNIEAEIIDTVARYGRLKLYKSPDGPLVLESEDTMLITELLNNRTVQPHIVGSPDGKRIFVKPEERGNLKSALIKVGFPVEDLAGYVQGAPLKVNLRETCLSGRPFGLRQYQRESVDAFYAGGA
ncbi:MAG: helicase-associated domain-containing protein, partial [Candidatus Hydrogenedentes bacterium]|nr:helicase-associated domain-containing protein [Candidatus Hydrogenedentota bacterium]